MKLSIRVVNLCIVAVVIGALLVSSSGVAAQPSIPGAGPSGVAQSGAVKEAKLNPDVAGTVEMWHFWASPVRRTAIKRVIAICQAKLPKITVNDTVKPFGDIWTANIAAVAAGSGMPDVIVEDMPQLAQRAADGIDQNLQERTTRDGVDPANYWPFAWNLTLYKGETYGIPFETDVRVLFYNKTLFQEAGLDPQKPPTSWADLEAMADKLDKKGADGKYERIAFFPLLFGNVGEDLWAQTNGVDWVKDGKPQIDNPAVAEALTWIKKWVDRYGGWKAVQEFRASLGAPPNDAFMSGKVAMLVDIAGYSSFLNFYRPSITTADGKSTRIDWGVTLPPYNKRPSSISGGFTLSIPTGAKNTDAAWEFIKCATGYDAQVSWARDTYAIPTFVAAANEPVLMADPNWKFFVEAMKVSQVSAFVAEYANWREQLAQRYEKIWLGELPVAQALTEAQTAVDKTMAENAK